MRGEDRGRRDGVLAGYCLLLWYYCSRAYYCTIAYCCSTIAYCTIADVPILVVLLQPCLLLYYCTHVCYCAILLSSHKYFTSGNTLVLLFLHVHTSTVPPTDWACSPSATRVTSSQPRAGQAGLPLNLFIPCHPRFPK